MAGLAVKALIISADEVLNIPKSLHLKKLQSQIAYNSSKETETISLKQTNDVMTTETVPTQNEKI